MTEVESLKKLYTSYMKEELRLNAEGQWFHDGKPFSHKRLSQLFHRSIQWDEEFKDFVIRIGQGRATFSHEAYVRFVVSLRESNGTLVALFADGSEQPLPLESLRLTEEEQFILLDCEKPNARLTRTAHQQLLEYAESERSLAIGNRVYTIPFLEE